jgi:hypothetical protein
MNAAARAPWSPQLLRERAGVPPGRAFNPHRGGFVPNRILFPETTPAAHGGEPSRFIYQIVPQAPPLDPHELDTSTASIEIVIIWGGFSVLHVAHLTPPRSFFLGEAGPTTDFVIGEETLGQPRLPLVLERAGELSVVVPSGAAAEIERDGENIAIEANSFPLEQGSTARIRHGDFTFIVRSVAAARRIATPRPDEPVWQRSRWTLLSAISHACLLALFYFLPPNSSALSMDRLDSNSRLVKYAIDAVENRIEDIPEWLNSQVDAPAAGGGKSADGPIGRAGGPTQNKSRGKLAVPGSAAPAELHMPRAAAFKLAQTAGIIGILRATPMYSPSSPYARDNAEGSDPMAVLGALLGEQFGAVAGLGGAGMVGTGRGGGGDATGTIGSGTLATLGHSAGPGGGGYGSGVGIGSYRRLAERVPRIRSAQIDLNGSLSKEVIRRIIARHTNEVRFCYESQLLTQPDLQGRVAIKFVIAPTGAVMTAVIAESDLGNRKLESCIADSVRRMDFPAPEGGGVVIVTYPFVLSMTGGS